MDDDQNNPKMTQLPTAYDEAQAEMESMKRAISAMLYVAPEIAAMKKKMYDEYLKVGFTKEEALALCQKMTL